MINFSELSEILNKQQKAKVNRWAKGDNSFSDHLFDHPEHTEKTISLEHPDSEGHSEDIKSHLEPHGIKIKDYKSGIGEDKYGREIKLGKALEKTKAPDELKNKFANDPSRSNKGIGSDDLRVTISRHPHHVAGMTSSGHSWENESCMNFETGCNKDYLKQDVKHGTHVAYLHHKDDKELEHPLARIVLKKFTDEETGHSVLRPENRTYGPASDAFTHTVHKFIDNKMPVHDSGIYRKNDSVYHDSGDKKIVGKGKEALNRILKNNKESISSDIVNHPAFTKQTAEEHIHRMPQYLTNSSVFSDDDVNRILSKHKDNRELHFNAARNKGISSSTIDKIIGAHPDAVDNLHPDNPNITKEHISKIIQSSPSTLGVMKFTNHQNFHPSHFDEISENRGKRGRRELLEPDVNLPKEHFDKFVKKDANSLNIHDKKDLIHIDKIIDHEHFDKDNAKHLLDNVPNVESNPRIHNSLLSRSTGVPHKRGTPLERFHAAIKSNNQ